MKRRSFLVGLGGSVLAPALASAQPAAAPIAWPQGLDRANALLIELKDGPVIVRLRPDLAPQHVERLKVLARRGFYDNLVFHRVIEGFMAQTGDPTGTGTGGSDLPNLRAEFAPNARFRRGTLGMARSASPDSANSQFFICFRDAPWLDGQYTIVGEVVTGMEAVDRIKRGVGQGGTVPEPRDRMLRVRVAADVT